MCHWPMEEGVGEREYFTNLQCESCRRPISWTKSASRASPKGFRISLTIGTSSLLRVEWGIVEYEYSFLGASLRSAKNNTRHSSRYAPSNPRSGSYSSLHSPYGLIPIVVTPRIFRYAQYPTGNDFLFTDDWRSRSRIRSIRVSDRNEEYWAILLYYPAREGTRMPVHTCAHMWGVEKRKPESSSNLAPTTSNEIWVCIPLGSKASHGACWVLCHPRTWWVAQKEKTRHEIGLRE